MDDSPVLYRSGRSRTLWLLLAVSLAPLALVTWLLTLPSEARLLQELGSATAVLAWKAGLLLLSSTLFWPMLWLSGRYVTEVRRVGPGRLRVRVWTLLGCRAQEWTGAGDGGEVHEGRLALPDAPLVDAPWRGFRTPGGRRLVVDAQGDFPQGEDALTAAMTRERALPPTP